MFETVHRRSFFLPGFAVGVSVMFLVHDYVLYAPSVDVPVYSVSQPDRLQACKRADETLRDKEQPVASSSPRKEEETAPGVCAPRKKFVFIKTHKTGGCTVINIFQRFVLYNKLKVLMPVGRGILSWPFPPREQDYLHTSDERYDALMHHMVYNRTWLLTKFPPDTPYISIIRNPKTHLKSSFNYYSFPGLLGLGHSQNPIKEFLKDPWKFKDKSEPFFPHVNVTWDGTRNPQAFDFGWPAERADQVEEARAYITQIEKEFTLVMILEHLDESLVLLRRLLCWSVQDVVYYSRKENELHYKYKDYEATPEEQNNHRRWSAVDYLLYDTFNKSLWRKIQAQSRDFHDEVQYFKRLKLEISDHCDRIVPEPRSKERIHLEREPPDVKTMVVKASMWSPAFVVDYKYCDYITAWKVHALDAEMRGRTYTKEEKGRSYRTTKANLHDIFKGRKTFFTHKELLAARIKHPRKPVHTRDAEMRGRIYTKEEKGRRFRFVAGKRHLRKYVQPK